jgi:hypothetical protein
MPGPSYDNLTGELLTTAFFLAMLQRFSWRSRAIAF